MMGTLSGGFSREGVLMQRPHISIQPTQSGEEKLLVNTEYAETPPHTHTHSSLNTLPSPTSCSVRRISKPHCVEEGTEAAYSKREAPRSVPA